MKRRNFLSGLATIAGSTLLAACGGGGSSDPTNPTNTSNGGSTGAAVPASSASSTTAAGATAASGAVATVPSTSGSSSSTPTTSTTDTTTTTPATTDTTPASTTTTTTTPVAVAAPIFYGVNGHFDYTYTPAQVITMLTTLGCTTYRLAVENLTNSLSAVAAMAKAFHGTGLTLFVCIDPDIKDSSGVLFASEQLSYNNGYSWGSQCAAALSQYGVTMYECGNELTRRSDIVLDSSCAGNKASDFNNTNWPIMRGAIRGMIDGVKSVQAGALCGVNFCVADIGASDALWNGTQPDGSTGHPIVRWDLTTWHNYEVYGDIFSIGTDGAGPGFDLPAYCKKQYGVPFMLTEWNANPEQSQSYRATYITQKLGEYYAARKTDNIDSVMYYVLDSGDTTWGLVINGTPNAAPYNAMKAFIASNPDN